jgi:hypothetical protein
LNALFFVALLLYLIPAAFGLGSSTEHRRRFQVAAIVTLGTAIAIAVVASVIWFTRWHLRQCLVLEMLNHDALREAGGQACCLQLKQNSFCHKPYATRLGPLLA